MELTSENVRNIFLDCLFEDEKLHKAEDEIRVNGITMRIAFNKHKVELHKNEIQEMLMQLPKTFRKSVGGGWSFLQACCTDEDVQWGEHRNMEELFCLGMAIGKVDYIMPREMWRILPGGVPYLIIDDSDMKGDK